LREQAKKLADKHGIEKKKKEPANSGEKKPIPLAIVGRPNVGKSTLLNTLTGESYAHVEDTP